VRVLVVDDHGDTLEMMRILLERRGFAVDVADGLAEARRVVERRSPDVIVSDVCLPDGSGLELRDVRAAGGPRLIALTGMANAGDRDEALRAGFDRHMAKPVDPERLAQAILELASS
jgi:CheY-like chemotaxis protein